jgi:type IV pilus assembly protein PilZ
MTADRRAAPRVPVTLAVQYRTGDELHRDRVLNRSAGGLFIRTSRPLPIGTELDLVIEIAGQPPIRQRARVVWERLLGKNAPPHEPEGMGVQFAEPIDSRLR